MRASSSDRFWMSLREVGSTSALSVSWPCAERAQSRFHIYGLLSDPSSAQMARTWLLAALNVEGVIERIPATLSFSYQLFTRNESQSMEQGVTTTPARVAGESCAVGETVGKPHVADAGHDLALRICELLGCLFARCSASYLDRIFQDDQQRRERLVVRRWRASLVGIYIYRERERERDLPMWIILFALQVAIKTTTSTTRVAYLL